MESKRGKSSEDKAQITGYQLRYPFKCPMKKCDMWFRSLRGALNHYDHHVREEYGG